MLTPQRLQKITSLLNAAWEVEPSHREAFIRENTRGDEPLTDVVLKLLEDTQAQTAMITGDLTPEVIGRFVRDAVGSTTQRYSGTGEDDFSGTSRFALRRRLGSGGFGTVYEAHDRQENRAVALKVLRRTDATFLYRFKREFRALVDVRHHNLVELYELFSEDRSWFFTMQLIHGVDFLRYVEHRPRSRDGTGSVACNVERVRAASLQLATGIAALHAAGIVHGDIKPSNILVSTSGRVRVLDFGLVREVERDPSQSMLFMGTPAYMSPEQGFGRPIGEPTDWYSFGLILFEALTGQLPDRGSVTADVSLATAPASFAPDVPGDLDELCRVLLRQNPELRPSSQEIIERLGGTAQLPAIRTSTTLAGEKLIGREGHLAELKSLLDVTRHGRTVVVNLHGTSGVGKSTLLRTFRQRLATESSEAVFLAGRCHESETVPFKALDDLIDGLSHYLKMLPQSETGMLVPHDAQYLVRLFPVLGRVEAIAQGPMTATSIVGLQELRERAFGSLQDLLSRLSDRRPVVLVIDDLQWGDLDSAAFIRRFLTAPTPPTLLFVASYRTDDVDTSPFLQAWRSHLANAESLTIHDLELRELTPVESEELAARLLSPGRAIHHPRVDSIVKESGGNPFLIDQLASYARRDPSQGQAVVSIQQVIEDRLQHLPSDMRRLLEIIALAGRPLAQSVACAAAGPQSPPHLTVSGLVSEHLVRVRETDVGREVEIYHDRIRETINASLSVAERKQHHLSLARALEAHGAQDAAALATHFQEAGDSQDAAVTYTLAAAEQALGALAFDRAARLFEAALDQKIWQREELVALRRRLAGALVDAGHGARAARVYLSAASEALSPERVELKRLASEQLLRSGHVEEGLDLLRAIARDLGIWVPVTPWQSILALSLQRIRVACRRLQFRPRPAAALRAKDLIVLDVYWSFVIGLGMFDPVQSLDFQARHMLLALRTGDRDRFAMSLATEAAHRAATSRRGDVRRIHELLAQAHQLSVGTSHHEALGLIAVMDGFCAMLKGDWRTAWDASSKAEPILQEKCTGVAWEQATNGQVAVTAAIHLGEWSKLSRYAESLPRLVREAKARGDIYAMYTALGGGHIVSLAADQPQAAKALVGDVIAALRGGRFSVQQFIIEMEAQVDTALYTGDALLARTLVESMWPQLNASLVMRVQYVSIMAFHLRARAAIATAAAAEGDVTRYLDEALRCARHIERERRPWGDVLALAVRAGVASFAASRAVTLELLASAETKARGAQMAQWVAACQHRRATLLGGGAEAPALMAAVRQWADTERVVNPTRIFDMFLPGRF